jgi:hypothetical protein
MTPNILRNEISNLAPKGAEIEKASIVGSIDNGKNISSFWINILSNL